MGNFDAVVFEDDPCLSEMIAKALEAICDSVITFDELAKMVSYRKQIIECPGLVWMDIRAPGNTEDDALNEIRSMRYQCPNSILVVMSGIPSVTLEKEVRAAGADAFAFKPLGITSLDFARLIAVGAINAIARRASSSPRILMNVCAMLIKWFQEQK